jgi:nucleotide-binding universal stress UspA family protein
VKVLIAVKGSEDELFFQHAATLAPLATADEILLAHVIDSTPRADLERGRERFLARRPLGEERSAELRQAEEERARTALQYARHALVAVGVAEERIHDVILRGKPNEELRRVADENVVDLIVVQGRPGRFGPHLLGKTARFLIDHAPRAALLVR